MEPTWVELLDERTAHLMKELTPIKLLPYLNLPTCEKQQITCDERNRGQEYAAMTLLETVKKRYGGPKSRKIFEELVRALRTVGLHQSALLLDPHFKVPPDKEALEDENSFPLGILGTAAEIRVIIRLLHEDTKKYFTSGERKILELYRDIKAEDTLKLRAELNQVLPEGAAFSAIFKANKDSVPGCKLRVSQISAADTIWNTYCEGSLKTILKEKLLEGIHGMLPEQRSRLKMQIHIMREDYETACHILSGKNQSDSTEEAQQLRNCRIPPVYLNGKRTQLRLRPYQEELASPALAGKNTIVCAPTNSGKTYVALKIAKVHLDKIKGNESGQSRMECEEHSTQSVRAKVLFVVNRVNLVLQQKQRFDYYLSKSSSLHPNGYDIADISGANAQDKSLVELMQENDVIVLTAQILVDALKSGRVSVSDFSLLIFDECHHTDKGHPYNEIMLQYLDSAADSSAATDLPQIVGLTASLGVGKAKNMADAQEHVLQLCANLDCTVIVTVEEHKKDLEGKAGKCKRSYHEIIDDDMDYFDNIIGDVMIKIERMVQLEPGPNGSPHMNRGSQQYQQWLVGLDEKGVTRGSRELVTMVQHLRVYNTALTIKKCCRVKDALNYVEEFHRTQDQRKFLDVDHQLKSLYEQAKRDFDRERSQRGEIKNPKLEAVAELLKKHYRTCMEEGGKQLAKGILFTATRENTKALKAWIDENSGLAFIKAERLVGTGKGEDGMTQFQQEENIANFRNGKVNLLISTSVGEEGIDIPDCTFVIRYNVRGNEIASVQSRGRVRDLKGKYEVVAGKESGVIEKENLNIIREAMMEDAIQVVKAMDKDEYKKKVVELQRQAMCHRQQRETSLRNEKQKRSQSSVKLFCRKCQVFACHAHSIRCIKEAHHVVIDEEFCSKICFTRNNVSRVINGIELTGPLFCLQCDMEWGTMLKYQAKEMPCIKAGSFGFEFESEDGVKGRRPYKKWKLVPLVVGDFDLCETEFDCSRMSTFEAGLKDGRKKRRAFEKRKKPPPAKAAAADCSEQQLDCSSDMFQLSLD